MATAPWISSLVAAVALAMVGCGESKEKAPAQSESASGIETAGEIAGEAPTEAAKPTEAEPSDVAQVDDALPEAAGQEDVPTAEDFEESATEEVTSDNLAAEVEAMEKELGQ